MSPLSRILVAIIFVPLLVAYYVWKWKRAGHAADALATERVAVKQSFEMLKHDPRFHQLWQYIAPRYRATFDPPPDGATYCIRYLALTDESYQRVYATQGGARYLAAYLERKDSPARLQVSMDLATGACRDVELSALAWSASIPVMY